MTDGRGIQFGECPASNWETQGLTHSRLSFSMGNGWDRLDPSTQHSGGQYEDIYQSLTDFSKFPQVGPVVSGEQVKNVDPSG